MEDEKYRRFRYGVQVNSLGLTEPQPETMFIGYCSKLAVTLSKARARAVQLPAWNEALVSRPWDQQWSLRMQRTGLRDRPSGIRRPF